MTFAYRGSQMHDFGTYRKAGINMALGTDTHPHDMVSEMRTALFAAKAAKGHVYVAYAYDADPDPDQLLRRMKIRRYTYARGASRLTEPKNLISGMGHGTPLSTKGECGCGESFTV